ncbi:hypothetical protein ACFELO_13085 [Oceanicaulis sp. LC35]|uniref:hypothetical protein n=1 Tax=Oceanicaulis sp. LC35 TaxID=3349635 RepID=UPI003F84E2F8
MANLPTAYASQNFGRKTLDFYAASGEVSGSDPRARADERSLTDYDGAKHTVRIMDRNFALEAGDQASVLRMQTGPSQRSRPVALVNHTQKGWSRTHPGASALLSRAGVARNVNWFLTMLLFALASIVMVWPALRTFLTEVDPGIFGGLPQFDLFALTLSALPDLGNWSFSESVAPVSNLIAQAGPFAAEHADAIVFFGLSGLAALTMFAARSWRLLWAPLFVGLVGAAALGLGGEAEAAGFAVGGYGLAALIFVIGGVINRIRDSARLERRIALLADHLERHPPEETIARSEEPEAVLVDEVQIEDDEPHAANDDAPAAIAVPVSAALSDTVDDSDAEAVITEDAADASTQAEAVEDEAAEGEAEAVDAEAPAVTEDEAVAVDLDETVLDEAEAVEETIEAAPADAEPVAEDAVLSEDTLEPALTESETGEADDVIAAVSEDAETVTELSTDETEVEAVELDAEAGTEASAEAEDVAGQEPVDAEDEGEAVAEAAAEDDAGLAGEAVAFEAETEVETQADPETLTSEDALEPALTAEAPDADAVPVEDEPLELAGLDAEEAERLKNDPRYAARAIVLPSPPPMPSAEEQTVEAVKPTGPVTRETRELRPSAPLTNRVMSLFSNPPVPPAPPAPAAPARSSEDEDA